MRKLSFALIPAALFLVACGGDDAVTPIDGPAANCTVSTASFGDKGALTGAAFFEASPNNAAIYRIAVQGWAREEAIREMVEGGYGFHPLWENLKTYIRRLDIEAIRREAGIR